MPNPQIFGAGQLGRSAALCAQRHVNGYRHVTRDPDKIDRATGSYWARLGLAFFGYYGNLPARGWREITPYVYVIFGNQLYQVAANGVATPIGLPLLTNAGPVFFDDDALQLAFSDTQGNLYVFQIFGVSAATGLAAGNMQIFPPGALGFLGARHFTYLDNVGVATVPGSNPLTSQQMQQSNIADFTGWNALAFSFADSKGDVLLACKGYKGVLYALGARTTEVWQNLGLSPFQFGRTPTAVAAMGLASVDSIVEFGDDGIALLAQAPGGQAIPALLTPNGYPGGPSGEGNPLLDADMVAAINAKDANGNLLYVTLSDAAGSTYMQDGHRKYLLTFPTAGKSWEFDGQSETWSELTSDTGVTAGVANNTPAVGVPTGVQGMFRGLRALHTDAAGPFGGRVLFSDWATGHIYQGLPTGVQDNDLGCSFPMQLVSQHLHQGNKMQTLNMLQFDMEEGVGNGLEPNPMALIEISRDKGRTWDAPVPAPIGIQGDYDNRVLEYMLGAGRDLTVRLTLAGQHKRVLTGEVADMEYGSV